jgi:hypothetical protein
MSPSTEYLDETRAGICEDKDWEQDGERECDRAWQLLVFGVEKDGRGPEWENGRVVKKGTKYGLVMLFLQKWSMHSRSRRRAPPRSVLVYARTAPIERSFA